MTKKSFYKSDVSDAFFFNKIELLAYILLKVNSNLDHHGILFVWFFGDNWERSRKTERHWHNKSLSIPIYIFLWTRLMFTLKTKTRKKVVEEFHLILEMINVYN